MKTVFIVDIYNPYSPYNNDVRKVFIINSKQICIREVTMSWGMPEIGVSFDDCAAEPQDFRVYDTYEEAENYINKLKKINRGI